MHPFVIFLGQETAGTSYYAKACNLLRSLTKAYDDELAKYDVILMPTSTYVAPKLITKDNPGPKGKIAVTKFA